MEDWPGWKADMDPPLIGEDLGLAALELPDYLDDRLCGWCGRPHLFSPFPEEWRPGRIEGGEKTRFGVLYQCTTCGGPHLAVFLVEAGEDGIAVMRPMKPERIFPTGVARPIEVPAYRGTVIEQCRAEAWADFHARRYRSAAVMARSTLQAMVRRYLSERKFFKAEVDALAEIAGPGWAAVGAGVKTLGDRWAHPDPNDVTQPTEEEAREVLVQMDEVLQFTGAMERVGHLVAASDGPNPDMADHP